MAVVVLRGLFHAESVDQVTLEALVMMIVFAGIGAVAGWIADYLVRENVESMFRKRVEWYRNGVLEAERSQNATQDN